MTLRVPDVKLSAVNAVSWRAVAAIRPRPGQDHFVAPITYYLCLSHYGGDWHSMTIDANDVIVGHLMWAIDEDDGSVWLGGLVIDQDHQGRGMGRAAVMAFLEQFAENGKANAALSYHPDNEIARGLYGDIGFEETGELDDGELVARFRGNLTAW